LFSLILQLDETERENLFPFTRLHRLSVLSCMSCKATEQRRIFLFKLDENLIFLNISEQTKKKVKKSFRADFKCRNQNFSSARDKQGRITNKSGFKDEKKPPHGEINKKEVVFSHQKRNDVGKIFMFVECSEC
jgi:hypothetical protein